MGKDLGCLEFVKVGNGELLSNPWTYGILFIDGISTPNRKGCYSALGRSPGYTGGNGNIADYGAKSDWQFISIWEGDICYNTGLVQHETMHALSFWHEMQRPDRDQFINFHPENVVDGWVRQFDKLSTTVWIDSGHPFELGSVMMYGSNVRSPDWKTYTMTLKLGTLIR